jgi:beta-glucuronidase
MTQASNSLESIHDEGYAAAFETRPLSHDELVFTGGRARESLNGRWTFTTDRFDTGLRMHWYRDAHRPHAERTEPWDYDVLNGETIVVPSCWNFARPQYWFYEGSAWYGRNFPYAPQRPGERVVLRVGAANYDTKLFLNGVCLGHHRGGSTPFCVELTAALQADNWLYLCVNNDRRLDRVPMRNCDWFNYGGIFREVELLRLPPVFIRDLFVRLVPDGGFRRIAVSLALSDPVDGRAEVALQALGIAATLAVAGGRAEAVLEAEPELWSPARPQLYEVVARFGDDQVADRIGLREIRAEGRRILLNGEAIRLRGISVHEDDRDGGRVSDEADLRRRFGHARELGCNFLRLAHYPHHERAAQIADELGFLIWAEIPVYWAIDFANPSTFADAANQLGELILRDRNRASVAIWGIGNENADTDARLAFMGRLAASARALDPTRLVAAACLVNKTARRMEDRLAEQLDVVGINEYYGWYEPDIADLAAIGAQYALDKPLIISEMGADGPAGRHGRSNELFTLEQMNACYRAQLETIAEIDAIQGLSPWILYDFRTERRKNSFQQGWNRKGLIAEDKATKKPAFETLQRFYREIW